MCPGMRSSPTASWETYLCGEHSCPPRPRAHLDLALVGTKAAGFLGAVAMSRTQHLTASSPSSSSHALSASFPKTLPEPLVYVEDTDKDITFRLDLQLSSRCAHGVITVQSLGHLIVPVVSQLCLPRRHVGKGSHLSAVSGVTFPKYHLCMHQACMQSPLGAQGSSKWA